MLPHPLWQTTSYLLIHKQIIYIKINLKKNTELHNLYFLSSLKATIKDYEKYQFYEQIYAFRT